MPKFVTFVGFGSVCFSCRNKLGRVAGKSAVSSMCPDCEHEVVWKGYAQTLSIGRGMQTNKLGKIYFFGGICVFVSIEEFFLLSARTLCSFFLELGDVFLLCKFWGVFFLSLGKQGPSLCTSSVLLPCCLSFRSVASWPVGFESCVLMLGSRESSQNSCRILAESLQHPCRIIAESLQNPCRILAESLQNRCRILAES